nr:hypothetical protein [Nocardia tengchongensis]
MSTWMAPLPAPSPWVLRNSSMRAEMSASGRFGCASVTVVHADDGDCGRQGGRQLLDDRPRSLDGRPGHPGLRARRAQHLLVLLLGQPLHDLLGDGPERRRQRHLEQGQPDPIGGVHQIRGHRLV